MAITKATEDAIKKAAQALARGDIVAFPTETVYGLGANALNAPAVAKIFAAKERPRFNPLIVHVLGLKEAEAHAVVNVTARKLAEAFWPGPLSLVLPRRARLRDRRTGQRRPRHHRASGAGASGGPSAARRVRSSHRGAERQSLGADQPDARPNMSSSSSAIFPR